MSTAYAHLVQSEYSTIYKQKQLRKSCTPHQIKLHLPQYSTLCYTVVMFRLPLDIDRSRSFRRKADIKPWLAKELSPWNVSVAIERSDNIKIVFRCRSGSPRCPFRIRANYSLKLQSWSLSVICDLHNHRLDNSVLVPIEQLPTTAIRGKGGQQKRKQQSSELVLPHAGSFVDLGKSKPSGEKLIDQLMNTMSIEVARVINSNIWENPALLAEQKDAAVARFVAELMEEYLQTDSKSEQFSHSHLSTLANEPDIPTQLPALGTHGNGTAGLLPSIDSFQNSLTLQVPESLTLSPGQLMKSHDLSDFKVDNLTGSQSISNAAAQQAIGSAERNSYFAGANISAWSTSLTE